MSTDQYPVLYVKGDQERRAHSHKDVVDLKFRGFVPAAETVVDEPAAQEPTYDELVAQAKDLQEQGHDLKANGSYDALLEAVTEAQSLQNELDA